MNFFYDKRGNDISGDDFLEAGPLCPDHGKKDRIFQLLFCFLWQKNFYEFHHRVGDGSFPLEP